MNIKQVAVAAVVAGAMLAAPATVNAAPLHVDGITAHQTAALSAVEQQMMDLINRARHNPAAEGERLLRLVAAEAAQLAALKADRAIIAAAHDDRTISAAALSATNTATGSREQYELVVAAAQQQTETGKIAAAGVAVWSAVETLPRRTNLFGLAAPLMGVSIEVGMENRVQSDEDAGLFALPAAPSATQDREMVTRVEADLAASRVDIARAVADLAAAQRALVALQHHA